MKKYYILWNHLIFLLPHLKVITVWQELNAPLQNLVQCFLIVKHPLRVVLDVLDALL